MSSRVREIIRSGEVVRWRFVERNYCLPLCDNATVSRNCVDDCAVSDGREGAQVRRTLPAVCVRVWLLFLMIFWLSFRFCDCVLAFVVRFDSIAIDPIWQMLLFLVQRVHRCVASFELIPGHGRCTRCICNAPFVRLFSVLWLSIDKWIFCRPFSYYDFFFVFAWCLFGNRDGFVIFSSVISRFVNVTIIVFTWYTPMLNLFVE